MPIIKCMVSRVYCGPKFEKVRLKKDESMAIEPGQVSFFRKLIASKAIVVMGENTHPVEVHDEELVEVSVVSKMSSDDPRVIDSKPEIKTVIAAAVNSKNTPQTIEMPSINLKKNNRAKHRHKNKRK